MFSSKTCPKCGAKIAARKSACDACGAISIDISSGRKRPGNWVSIWYTAALGTAVASAVIHIAPKLAAQYYKNDAGYMSTVAFLMIAGGALLGTIIGAIRAPKHWKHPVVIIGWIPILAVFYSLHALAQSALAAYTLDELVFVDLIIGSAGPLGALALPFIVGKALRKRA